MNKWKSWRLKSENPKAKEQVWLPQLAPTLISLPNLGHYFYCSLLVFNNHGGRDVKDRTVVATTDPMATTEDERSPLMHACMR